MNNKRLGSMFERELCDVLADKGYWVHFIAPDNRGAQPFDVIAVKDGKPLAIDCKTSVRDAISIGRLETNQILAFEHWIKCGNGNPIVAVKHKGDIYFVLYLELKRCSTIKLTEDLKI